MMYKTHAPNAGIIDQRRLLQPQSREITGPMERTEVDMEISQQRKCNEMTQRQGAGQQEMLWTAVGGERGCGKSKDKTMMEGLYALLKSLGFYPEVRCKAKKQISQTEKRNWP